MERVRLESILCPTQHLFICLSCHGCLSNLTWKKTWSETRGCPWGLVPSFHLSISLSLSLSKITFRIFKSYARTTSSPRHTPQFPQNKWGSNQKEETPPRNLFLTWIQLMMNLCPRKIFCRTPLLELKALAQASPLPVNTDTQPHSTARCEQPHEDTSYKFKNVLKTSSQGGMTYFDSLLRQTRSFSFCWPQHACFEYFFETLNWYKPEVPTHTRISLYTCFKYLFLLFSSTAISLPKCASIILSRQFTSSLVLRISTQPFICFTRVTYSFPFSTPVFPSPLLLKEGQGWGN